MLHVMHIIESLEFGGAEKVVVHLANKLSSDIKISVCLTKRYGELAQQLNKNIKIFCLHSPEGNNYSLPRKIRHLLTTEKIDILHSHNWGVYLESALAVKKFKNIKFIHTVHGPYMNYKPGIISSIKIKLRHLAEKFLSKYVYKIVTVSDSIKKYVEKDMGITNSILETIHNGIYDIGDKLIKTRGHEVKFISVGRMAKIKNQKFLLSVFKKLIETQHYCHLTLVGDGPESDSLIRYCDELDLNEFVTFLGFRTDIKEILLQHDVFLLSSYYEGISIALLEAMSMSMPTVATAVGGLPDTVIDNKTGYLVPVNDASLYKEKLQSFINEPDKISMMGKHAREYFLVKFHEDVVINAYRSLYNKCQANNL